MLPLTIVRASKCLSLAFLQDVAAIHDKHGAVDDSIALCRERKLQIGLVDLYERLARLT
ncbi:hypothetical protein [Mesorhizobium sp. WSM3859]|uniref:hypothetical protein n=1 Tax=Mesorhizobium sp. WSM3859 TaxID=2029402 RepID=UPI0015964219|nr:hypothetical protein [Mesorhizobium sp. WSM3859]